MWNASFYRLTHGGMCRSESNPGGYLQGHRGQEVQPGSLAQSERANGASYHKVAKVSQACAKYVLRNLRRDGIASDTSGREECFSPARHQQVLKLIAQAA